MLCAAAPCLGPQLMPINYPLNKPWFTIGSIYFCFFNLGEIRPGFRIASNRELRCRTSREPSCWRHLDLADLRGQGPDVALNRPGEHITGLFASSFSKLFFWVGQPGTFEAGMNRMDYFDNVWRRICGCCHQGLRQMGESCSKEGSPGHYEVWDFNGDGPMLMTCFWMFLKHFKKAEFMPTILVWKPRCQVESASHWQEHFTGPNFW